MTTRKVIHLSLLCFFVLAAMAKPVNAIWGRKVAPFIRPEPEYSLVAPDGAGGAIVVWRDVRDGLMSIYARRVDSNGDNLWAAGGVPVYGGSANSLYIHIVEDGSGGAIIAWSDYRSGELDLYAQRIDSNGMTQWTLDGVAVCTVLESQVLQDMVPDGSGGAILTWADYRNGTDTDIYTQRIDASGAALWTADGFGVCTATSSQYYLDTDSDGFGGVVIAWKDFRNGTNEVINVQRVTSTGVAFWPLITVSPNIISNADDVAITSDGGGGAIVSWTDDRSVSDALFAQRVNSIGTVMWTANGVFVSSPSGLAQHQPCIVSDGSNGAIITWVDDSLGHLNPFAQRLNSTGTILWGLGGVALTSVESYIGSLAAHDDGAGGAVITWLDDKDSIFNNDYDIYAQRLDGSGTEMWTSGGVSACPQPDAENNIDVSSDGSGGVLITFPKGDDIRVQRVTSAGVPSWQTTGIIVCDGTPDQRSQRLVSDGAGGAIFVWIDEREEKESIYSQRLDNVGSVMWATEGYPVCSLSGNRDGLEVISDEAGGAVMTWLDERGGNWDVFVQRINGSGVDVWLADGIAVCSTDSSEAGPRLVSDGTGGAIIAWVDARGSNLDIYAQRVDSGGNILWTVNGVPVCTASSDQDEVRIMPDGSGGAVISWIDGRTGNDDVYSQRVNSSGVVQWTSDGVSICADLSDQTGMELVSDGSGGGIALWIDDRNGGRDIFAQRIGVGGTVLWTAGGVEISDRPYDINELSADQDGLGGVVLAFEEQDPANTRVNAQRVGSSGQLLWSVPEIAMGWPAGIHTDPDIVSDGSGGATIAWVTEYSTSYASIQHIEADGQKIWVDGLLYLDTVVEEPRLVYDGAYGAIVTWTKRSNTYNDYYYNDVMASGFIGAICDVEFDEIDFGTVDLFDFSDTTFIISNVGDLPFFGELNESSDHFSIESGGTYSIQPGISHEVTVRFTSNYPDSHLCILDSGRLSCGSISLTGFGFGPVCDIDAAAIAITEIVRVGSNVDTSFTITNNGGGQIIGEITEDSDHYAILSGGGPFALFAGESRLVELRFEPGVKGTHECVVETGAFGCSEVTITGEAFECPPGSVLYVDADAGGTGDGTSWIDAFVSLQDALTRSQLCGDISEIWVADGTYYPTGGTDRYATFQLRDSLAIYGGFAGTESMLSKRDLFANSSVLCGDIGIQGDVFDNSLHVVTGSLTDSTAVLDGFTVTSGYSWVPLHVTGGGMYNEAGSPTLRNLIIRDNTSRTAGGGMYNLNGSDPVLYNVVFCNNTVDDFGGGMYNEASSPTLVNVTFSRNRTQDSGAAMFNEKNSNPTLTNVIMYADSTPYMTLPEIGNHNNSFPVISYSLIQYCGGSGGHWETTYGIDGGNNLDGNPRFVNLSEFDLHLMEGSPASEAGDLSVPGLPAIDLDGNPRIQGGDVDMGAYEGEFQFVRVDILTSPSNLEIILDGNTLSAPGIFMARNGEVHEIGTITPQVQGEIIYSFTGWSDAGDTIHTVIIPGTPIMYTASFSGAYLYAAIDSIVDVPGDQGGWARVYFSRSHYDNLSEIDNPIERYDMHRRVDSPVLVAAVLAEGKRTEDGYIEYDGRLFVVRAEPVVLAAGSGGIEGAPLESDFDGIAGEPAAAPPGLWEVVGTVSASQQEQYIGLAPTLADSSAMIPWSAYYVSAHSTAPAVYFDSPADSGYSVDNIAPGAPLGFAVDYNTGSGNELSWDSAPESDFQYYRIYRDTEEGFIPGPGNLIHQTVTPIWSDPDYDGWDVYYKITTLDYVGNESGAASPGSTTGDDLPGVPKAFALHQNVPNPFNPATTIRFDLPQAAHVSLCVYNVKGELISTIVDQQMTEGRKEINWMARDASGKVVVSGMYFYRLVAGDFVQTRKMVLLR